MTFYSQFGEDQLLADHFSQQPTGVCIEVGALDGMLDSNTLHFEQHGWTCLLVEANPEMAAACRTNRPKSTIVECAVVGPDAPPQVTFQIAEDIPGLSSLAVDQHNADALNRFHGRVQLREVTVNTQTLDTILATAQLGPIHFMTIDVEGQEWNVLQGFDLTRWQPKIVIIERNHHFPRWRMLRHFHQHGYALRRTTGVNDWFVRADSAEITASYRAKLLTTYYIAPLPAWVRKQADAAATKTTRQIDTTKRRVRATAKRGLERAGLLGRVKRLLRLNEPA